MNSKSSNISKWVFGALALVTIVIAVLFYLVAGDVRPKFLAGEATPRTDLFLNWGYILIILGIVIALVSVIFTAVVKGVNGKTLLIGAIAAVIIAVVAYLMSKAYFSIPYSTADVTYSGKTHGLVEFGLNFFYVTFAVAILAILFSIIYKAVKK